MDWGTCHTTATAQVNELNLWRCVKYLPVNVFFLKLKNHQSYRSLYTSTFPFQAATIVNSGPTSVLCPTYTSLFSKTLEYCTVSHLCTKKTSGTLRPKPTLLQFSKTNFSTSFCFMFSNQHWRRFPFGFTLRQFMWLDQRFLSFLSCF